MTDKKNNNNLDKLKKAEYLKQWRKDNPDYFKKYYKKHKKKMQKSISRYRKSPKGKAVIKAYEQSEKRKAIKRAYQKKLRQAYKQLVLRGKI